MSIRPLVLCLVVVAMVGMVAPACATDKPRPPPALAAAAAPLPVAPLALAPVDAPGLAVKGLTAAMGQALQHHSGVVVVDAFAVQAELAACVQMPCADMQQQKYTSARFVGSSTISRLGDTLLGSVRINDGLTEVVRLSAEGTEEGALATELGARAGIELRRVLSTTTPVPAEPPPAPLER